VHGLVVLNTNFIENIAGRTRTPSTRVSSERDDRNSEHTGREAEGRGDLLASRCSARSRRHPAGRIHTARVQVTAFGFRLFAAEI